MEPQYYTAIGGLIGVAGTAAVNYFMSKRNRAQNYYSGLLKLLSDCNWFLAKEGVRDGLDITGVDMKVTSVCYNHLNLLYFAWLHRETVEEDGSMRGWKNWGNALVRGARAPQNADFHRAYARILEHGDMYPRAFLDWLDQQFGLSAATFRTRTSEGGSMRETSSSA